MARLARVPAWDRLCAGSAIAALVASFLPWTARGGERVAGVQGDGQISMLCAILALAVLALGQRLDSDPRFHRLAVGAQFAVATLVLCVGVANASLLRVDAGLGVWVTVLAALSWLAGAVVGWRTPRRHPLDDFWY